MALRNELDLFVNVLECKSYPGIVSRHQNIDIVIVRQNTEGEYAMLEHEVSSNLEFPFDQFDQTISNLTERSWRCGKHESCYNRQ